MKATERYMKIGLITLMMGLFANFSKAQCTANFSDTTSACAIVQFTNLSTNTTSLTNYSWNFSGGSPATSTLQNPSSTYTSNGFYTVCLQLFSAVPSCSSTICKTITVNCFTTTCTANFNTTLCLGGQMTYINTSPGTNSTTVYDWDLGNSTTSNAASPTATYSANGIYTVCLSYTTTAPAYCTATICKTVNISCVPSACPANFTTLTCAPNGTTAQITFSNTSVGTNSNSTYSWSFGNNTTSTLQSPMATYTANGTYTVCLTSVTTGSPPCTDSICKVITVTCVPVPTCQANFTNTPCNNGQVTFYSTSSGTTSSTNYTWTNSSPPNSPPGPYTATVCLKMVNTLPACTHSVCKTIQIDCVIGVAEFIFENGRIKIFPNPSNGLFNLDLNHANLNSSSVYLKVYNILGELVHQSTEEVDQGKLNKEIDLQSLPNGAYFLRLNAGNSAYSVKLIITK